MCENEYDDDDVVVDDDDDDDGGADTGGGDGDRDGDGHTYIGQEVCSSSGHRK